MYNKMVEENNKKNGDQEIKRDLSLEHIQKINSSKNIKKDEQPKQSEKKGTIPQNKVPPKSNTNQNNSNVMAKKEEPKKEEPKK